MADARASLLIKNTASTSGLIQLYHTNHSGVQSEAWMCAPGCTCYPMTVLYKIGLGHIEPDFWTVRLTIPDGPLAGIYLNSASLGKGRGKECQLQAQDNNQALHFEVDTKEFRINLPSGSCKDSMTRIDDYHIFTNVFVLMLENHSFDNMLAMSGIPGINAANSTNVNSYNNTAYAVQGGAPNSMPSDPGHEFLDVVQQLTGVSYDKKQGTGNLKDLENQLKQSNYPQINNSGFASNYAITSKLSKNTDAASSGQVGDIMKCFNTRADLPVLYELATEFAVCDHWYSSLPGPTWPNRYFVHGGTSSGLDHSPNQAQTIDWEYRLGFKFKKGSIFEALDKANRRWRLYHDNKNQFADPPGGVTAPLDLGSVPQVASIRGIEHVRVRSFSKFAADLQSPFPYNYTFIEPNYGDILPHTTYKQGSSQHPMDDVRGGEGLIKATYEAIRFSPLWYSSLLIIIYDEHGGYYDSVQPPAALPPNDGRVHNNRYGFTFNQYGVRVPAIVVSPFIPKGEVNHEIYDHSSVLATLEKEFGVHALTDRDGNANSVRPLLKLTTPRWDCPMQLGTSNQVPASKVFTKRSVPTPAEEAASAAEPLPEEGNVVGFLQTVLKTELALSGASEAQQAVIVANFNSMKTKGEAAAYVRRILTQVEAARASADAKPVAP